LTENTTVIEKALVSYINSTKTLYSQIKPTFASLANLTMPGYLFNGWAQPGSMFGVSNPKPAPESWWMKLCEIAMRRTVGEKGIAKTYEYYLFKAKDPELIRLAALMHTVYSTYCPYTSDRVAFNRTTGQPIEQDIEMFSCNLRSRGTQIPRSNYPYRPPGGDCEDLSTEAVFQALELRKRKDFQDPLLRRLYQARQKYIAVQLLMGVHGAQSSDGAASTDLYNNLGGHMAAAYMSKARFLSMCKTHSHNWSDDMLPRGSEYWPIEMMEGTGLVDPSVNDDRLNTARKCTEIYARFGKSVDNWRIIMPTRDDQPDNFYRVIQEFNCPEFATKNLRNTLFTALRGASEPTFGITYTEFITSKNPNIFFKAAPNMSTTQVEIMKNINAQMFPVISHGLVKEANPMFVREAENLLESLRSNKPAEHFVDFYLPFHAYDKDKITQFIRDARRDERIVSFNFNTEIVGQGVGGFQLILGVK
jgi:hypothetical protein